MNRPQISFLYVLSVPYIAALVPIEGFEISGLRYTGFLWVGYYIVGLLLILTRSQSFPFPWKIWLPWFLYVAISYLWSSGTVLRNLQVVLQMSSPVVVGVVASFSIRTTAQWRQLKRGFSHCLLILVAGFLFYSYGPVSGALSDRFTVRPAAMTLTIVAALFIANFKKEPVPNILGWMTCLSLSALSGSRTATVVVLLLWPLSPVYRNSWRRFIILFSVCILGIGLFYTPVFQNRFFVSGKGELAQVMEGDYNDAGRSAVWAEVREESKRQIVFGAGVGESDIFVSSIFDDIGKTHNDYLRILFEFGIVGLTLFLVTMTFQMVQLRQLIRVDENFENTASIAAYLAICAWLLLSYTDNGIIYGVYFTHLIFAFIGAAYGMDKYQNIGVDRKKMNSRTTSI